MKKVLIILLLIFPLYARADYWDHLTREEAEEVQAFLSNCPFILDYCDCCDFEGEYATKAYLMKVTSTEIVTCHWDDAYYSVKAKVDIIAELPYSENGLNITKPLKNSNKDDLIITMNYTWSYSEKKAKAVPLFFIVSYDYYGANDEDSGLCRNFTDFPNPFKTNDVITDKEYRKWYKKNFMI
ncbi:MAG: hypothetical protein K8R54_17625 [Bacteroidales bacterium]|nr:hypothetical protein [Bacteroidales bacterium]